MIEGILSRWNDLALFRRALKAVNGKGKGCPDTQITLKKRLGVFADLHLPTSVELTPISEIEARTAGQVWKRLEQEG